MHYGNSLDRFSTCPDDSGKRRGNKMKVYKVHQAPAGAVYIGRGSPWGNPFPIGPNASRDQVIEKFRIYAEARLIREPEWLIPLRGKDIVCFCSPLKCHGDILIEMANK